MPIRKPDKGGWRLSLARELKQKSELDQYLDLYENARAELEGRPPPHPDLPEEPYDPVLEAYFAELEEQRIERDRALEQAEWRRRQHG